MDVACGSECHVVCLWVDVTSRHRIEHYCMQVEKWRSNTAVVRKWRWNLAGGGHGCGSGDGTLQCLGSVDPNPAIVGKSGWNPAGVEKGDGALQW